MHSEGQGRYVLHRLYMPHRSAALAVKSRSSHGTHLLDHRGLAEVAGFAGGQAAAPAVLEVDADLIGV